MFTNKTWIKSSYVGNILQWHLNFNYFFLEIAGESDKFCNFNVNDVVMTRSTKHQGFHR